MTLRRTPLASATSAAPSALPAHAGARTGRFDPSRSLYNAKASNLIRARSALGKAKAGTGLARVGFLGDSLMAGYTGSGSLAGSADPVYQFGQLLTARGIANVDSLVQLYHTGSSVDARISATSGTFPIGGEATQLFPWSNTSGAGGFTLTAKGTVLEILDGGQAYTYNIDGAGAVSVSSTTATTRVTTVTGLTDTTHSVVFALPNGSTYLHSAGLRHTTGIVLQNGGITSSTTTQWTDTTDQFRPLNSFLAAGGVKDLVFVELGTNDATAALSTTTYAANLSTIVDTVRATGSDVVLVASNRQATGFLAAATWDSYLSKIYDVADAKDVPLLDLTDVFGAFTAYNGYGLAADSQVHLSAAGNAAKAQALAAVLGM